MERDKKTPLEVAMEKDCIFLVVAEMISQVLQPTSYMEGGKPDLKCRGTKCAEFDQFTSRCGFSK